MVVVGGSGSAAIAPCKIEHNTFNAPIHYGTLSNDFCGVVWYNTNHPIGLVSSVKSNLAWTPNISGARPACTTTRPATPAA